MPWNTCVTFRGSLSSYLAALRRIGLSRSAARGLLLDELRRDAVRARFRPRRPSAAAIAEFHRTYADFRARLVETARPVAWLGWRKRGLALETFAPLRTFSLQRAGRVRTSGGPLAVRPLGETVLLGAVPPVDARAAIISSLDRFARVAAYESWLSKVEARALNEATCAGDELPVPTSITLDDLLQ